MGEGFTWETQDLKRDIAAAEAAWAKALELMDDASISLVVLDELNIALRYDYLDLEKVVAALKARREGLHVVVTGRNAKPALIEAADLVTEMGVTKHHFLGRGEGAARDRVLIALPPLVGRVDPRSGAGWGLATKALRRPSPGEGDNQVAVTITNIETLRMPNSAISRKSAIQ